MNIGSNIKKLRRERDITQEQLAEYLNISVSAISQWEGGKTTPDISLLAPLANIFEVSADVLLGIDVINKEKQIRDIVANAEKYHLTDCEESVSMLREGLKEYPNSFEIMERLMSHIYSAKIKKTTLDGSLTTDKALIMMNEVIKLGEKILAECTDDKLRFMAVNTLCYAYSSPEMGMTEKAIELAEKLPHTNITRESLLAYLYEGEKKFNQLRGNIQKYFGELVISANELREKFYDEKEKSESYDARTIEESIIVNKKIIALIKIMIEDEKYGFYGFIMVGCYSSLALNYAKLNDYDKAIEYLRRSTENVIKMNTEYKHFSTYTSLLLKGTQSMRSFYSNENFSIFQLEQMKHTAFDPIRERKEFKEIEEKLKNTRRTDD